MPKEELMKPFRKNVAIAIDGGGIRGVIPARALTMLEQELSKSTHDIFRLTAGTSTGSIIAAGIAAGMSAEKIDQLYLKLGNDIFHPSFQTFFWPFFNHRYPRPPLERALRGELGNKKLGDLWTAEPRTDTVLTTFDVLENRTRFLKSWKAEYHDWPLVKAVLASAAAPTYFPSVDGRFIDGGVGSFNNPCYLAAFEILFFLGNEKRGSERWKPEETTLISLGTGRDPNQIKAGAVDGFLPIQWISHLLDAFSHSADDQQVFLTKTFFHKLDFRRYQVDLEKSISLDNASQIPELIRYGEKLGRLLLGNKLDRSMQMVPTQMPQGKKSPTKSASRRRRSKSGSPRALQPRTSAGSARAPRRR
jgi:hypothetical protein